MSKPLLGVVFMAVGMLCEFFWMREFRIISEKEDFKLENKRRRALFFTAIGLLTFLLGFLITL